MTAEVDFKQHTTGAEWAALAAKEWVRLSKDATLEARLVQLFDRAMEERTQACIVLCEQRAEDHYQTVKQSEMSERRLVDGKAREARKCAAHIGEALKAYKGVR